MPTDTVDTSLEYDVFLSYAGVDQEYADGLYEKISQHVRVFIDREELDGGNVWGPELVERLDRSRCTVALISENTRDADVQKQEIMYAINRWIEEEERHFVVPVYVRAELKELKYASGSSNEEQLLGCLHAYSMQDLQVSETTRTLIELLQKHGAADSADPDAVGRPSLKQWLLVRWHRWMLSSVVLTLALLGSAGLLWRQSKDHSEDVRELKNQVQALEKKNVALEMERRKQVLALEKKNAALEETRAKQVKNRERMVLFPAGAFKLPRVTRKVPRIEKTVKVPFWIDRYEVSVGEYEVFATQTKRKMPKHRGISGPNYPVNNVPYEDAKAFCHHRGARLPRVEEWERANMSADNEAYILQPDLRDKANLLTDDGNDKLQVVNGGKDVTPTGLRHLAGNVSEWVIGVDTRARGDSKVELAEIRGKSIFSDYKSSIDQIFVGGEKMVNKSGQPFIGFRCAVTGQPGG